jgi:excisionase family DNA binding protein
MEAVLDKQYITIHQAAKARGVHYYALYRWIKRHDVPLVHVGRSIIVKESDLVGYVPRFR